LGTAVLLSFAGISRGGSSFDHLGVSFQPGAERVVLQDGAVLQAGRNLDLHAEPVILTSKVLEMTARRERTCRIWSFRIEEKEQSVWHCKKVMQSAASVGVSSISCNAPPGQRPW
jgi:hypothetical protein